MVPCAFAGSTTKDFVAGSQLEPHGAGRKNSHKSHPCPVAHHLPPRPRPRQRHLSALRPILFLCGGRRTNTLACAVSPHTRLSTSTTYRSAGVCVCVFMSPLRVCVYNLHARTPSFGVLFLALALSLSTKDFLKTTYENLYNLFCHLF
jgi:hypothetical protein